jgi:hypothetical protein
MADTAYQTMYRKEFIAGFEKRQSLVRKTVTTETEVNGNEAVFLVADSGGATAVTRGVNGDIPTRPDNLNQYTATLKDWHDVPERTNFNIFASQGDGRRIMQETSMAVINRKIDTDIHDALSAATVTQTMTQSTKIAFLSSLINLRVTLGNANASQDELFALITPAFHGNMMQLDAFTSADYVNLKPFENVSKDAAFRWHGINWIVDTGLSGLGATSTCYAYAKTAIGHGCDMERISTHVGYDEKNDKSWARCTAYMGSKLLQNSGIIKISHDDTDITLT